MKSLIIIFVIGIICCLLTASIFLGIAGILRLLFPSLSLFQGALLLMVPFCILMVLLPLLLINQKMEQMVTMTEDDYMFLDEEYAARNRIGQEEKISKSKGKQKKIIVMESSPIIDRNASCPCGSGEKYKNCCGEKGKKG